jgi:hypothetical protein
MAYTINDLKQDLVGTSHGTTLNQIQGVDQLIYRAGRKLLNDCDPMETIRIGQINNALYDQVYDYILPDDLKGDRIIDIRPMLNRNLSDRFTQWNNNTFDMQKDFTGNPGGAFTIQYNTGIKSVRIAKNIVPGVLVNDCDNPTSNGIWTVSNLASNIRTNTVNFVQGGGALMLDFLAGADPSTATISNDTMTAIDISDQEDQGSFFLAVYFPDATIINSVELQWGSSLADYWTNTVTGTQSANVFQNGWNILRFDWQTATEVGVPDATAIDTAVVNIEYDGTATTGVLVDNLSAVKGLAYQIVYYSKFLFRDANTGAFQETVTDDSNIINLDVDSYNLLFNLCAYYAAQQQQGGNSAFDVTYFLNEYQTHLKNYVAKIKSQTIAPMNTYYRMPRRNVVRILPY